MITPLEFFFPNLLAVAIVAGVGAFVVMAAAAWVRDWWTQR